ncbi:hypothetical protein XBP1_270022 [Xenorhabdus bovienii str. puntauvense]|uniref:Uncharacterized protein n=3 Tax=Xenorhabdus bovienii TaxID=40576 RepID=A0A077P3G0_XENBV|nr:hypothetical protein XBP1_270022 [Xenorhabdus bovienii str. puntauvense]CDH05580.1 hypothetical protein XBO1_1950021 [Xenorhabdus bovienii str. oregonense]CDH24040.1 hypothetical protein XBKB1_2360010 [Xenorhabdus bovienii str. kraussei Becker Underwood]
MRIYLKYFISHGFIFCYIRKYIVRLSFEAFKKIAISQKN